MLEAFYRFNITGEWIKVLNLGLWKLRTISVWNFEAITCLPQNRHLSWGVKMSWTQRRTLVSPWRMYCMHSSMAKGTYRAEATSNSENIKPNIKTRLLRIVNFWKILENIKKYSILHSFLNFTLVTSFLRKPCQQSFFLVQWKIHTFALFTKIADLSSRNLCNTLCMKINPLSYSTQ